MSVFACLRRSMVSSTLSAAKKDDNPEEALKDFRAIVEQEQEQGDWQVFNSICFNTAKRSCLDDRGFKALKQSTKLLYLVLRRPNDALATYTKLLTYTKSAVTRNYSEKTINGILDYVGGGKGGVVEVDVLEKFYQATKDALEDAKNEVRRFLSRQNLVADDLLQRLSAKTNLKLAKLWLDRKEYARLSKARSFSICNISILILCAANSRSA